jgi:tetratricopeptide (TPR) repeat protein
MTRTTSTRYRSGYAYVLSERIPEALSLLQQAVAQDPSRVISAGHARRVAYLSEAYLLAGRRDEAMDLAVSTLTFARTLKAWGNEAYALWLHGEIHLLKLLELPSRRTQYNTPSRKL